MSALTRLLFTYVHQLDGTVSYLYKFHENAAECGWPVFDEHRFTGHGIPKALFQFQDLFPEDVYVKNQVREKKQHTVLLQGKNNRYSLDLESGFQHIFTERAVLSSDGAVCAVKGVAFRIPLDSASQTETQSIDFFHQLAVLILQNAVVDSTARTSAFTSKNELQPNIIKGITEIFDKEFRNHPEDDQWESGGGVDYFSAKIRFFVERSLPIQLVLPAFPCKSSNRKKINSTLPDLGEELAYRSMDLLARKIVEIYPPGATFLIVSDGHVFSDLSKISVLFY